MFSIQRLIFFFLFGMAFCFGLNAQELYQPEADSIVYSESEDYEKDTLNTLTLQRSGFHKGQSVWDSVIHYRGKRTWEDSTLSKTLFLNGKKVKTLSRTVRYHEREEHPNYSNYVDYGIGYGDTKTTVREPTVHIETTTSSSETIYLDSMVVTNYKHIYETDTTYTYDTLEYCFNNRFFKYHSECWHGRRVILRKRDYVFDQQGKLKAHKNYTSSGSYPIESYVEVMLHGKDTLSLVDTRTEWRDTIPTRHVLTSSFDSNYRQTGHLWLINGKESSKSESSYYPNGKVKETKQWWEGKLRITTQYWWKEQKGRQEVWTHQDNDLYSEHSGDYYGRTDTVSAKGKKIIKSYGYRLKSPASECKPVKRSKLSLSYRVEYDDKGRRIVLINYSGGKKNPGYVVRTRYSK